MTLREAQRIVKDCGFRLEYDRDINEYCVFTPYNARDAYYTNDREDAINTARAMALKLTQKESQ